MKKDNLSEKNFEVEHVVNVLVEKNRYLLRQPEDYDKNLFLDPEILLNFIKSSQPKEWKKLEEQYSSDVKRKFLKRVSDEVDRRGSLDVLRNGIQDRGARFELAYFKPVSGLNLEHAELYAKNQFSVIRQFPYSNEGNQTIDVALFLNGLPIITAELKNHFTGQDYTNAIKQYKYDRNPKEPFFKRVLVHFAVDNDKVFFTTKLEGEFTRFLPFNKDLENPNDQRGFKSSYLYYDIWSPDSLLEIISQYLQIEEKKDLIFPRFHQLTAVQSIIEDAKQIGSGKNYLIQHSAGSGKTYTISWLAHHLSQIHNAQDQKIFGSVIVVSDRTVIDKQLREAIKQFEKTLGVVWAAEHSRDLREALESGKNIIVTTIQKFPFVVDQLQQLKEESFAVLIDEAHSSQSGQSANTLNKTLSYSSLENAEKEDPPEDEIEDKIIEDIRLRGRLKHVSFFAFTATPKRETLELFGDKQSDGSFVPFSLYSMKQAIEEGFILDVLENYISYKTYFKILKKIEADPEFDKRKATAVLRRYVDLHEHAIEKKTEIMLDHFLKNVKGEMRGRAKAMVVTKSRLHAVRYKLEFDRQLKELGSDIKALVAFTARVDDGGNEYTETSMNGFPESQTRDRFDTDEYRILIVASKFQTGFDQPLLQTMYVDKKLNGLSAVQTLSRLNRAYPGKDKAIVLDFVNDPDDIQKAFQPYYQTAILSEGTDPNILYTLEQKIKEFSVIEDTNILEFARLWYTSEDQSSLHRALDPAIKIFNGFEEGEQMLFRKLVQQFVKTYAFVSQIVTFEDSTLEKLYLYCRFLFKKIPPGKIGLPKEVLESVDMDRYRVRKIFSGHLILKDEDSELKYNTEPSTTVAPTEIERLSLIISRINESSGASFTEEDKVKLGKITDAVKNDEGFQESRKNNTKSNLQLLFKELFDKNLGDMYEKDFNFYRKIEDNPRLKALLKEELFEAVFSNQ
ncbi:MAG: DEAD/DEAH box helicase family protein [Patescibacteria group bacterium]